MSLNTRIRGVQIKDADISALQLGTDAVETLKIKDLNVTLGKLADMGLEAHILVADASLRPVSVAVSGDITITAAGVTAIGSDVIINADVKSDAAIAESKLALDYSTSGLDGRLTTAEGDIDTLEGKFPVAEADMDIHSAPTDGYVLYWNDGEGKLDYKAIDVEAVLDTDVKFEDKSGTVIPFDLVSTPVVNSVQVFLNGLLQQEGSGKDYTLSTKTVTFTTAPEADDNLLVHYIASA